MAKFIDEFKEFAFKGNVVDMAVGVIIGGAFGKIVSSVVGDLIMPLIAAIWSVNVSDLKLELKPGAEAVVNESGRNLIKNRLLATKDVTCDITVQKDKIGVAYTGTMKIPAGTLLCRYLTRGRDTLEIKAASESSCVNPVSMVRKMRIVEGYAKGLSGASQGGSSPVPAPATDKDSSLRSE